MTIPDFRPGMKVTAQMFLDIWKQLRRQRITFSERFTYAESAGGTVVDLASSGSGSASFATGVATSSVTAASSVSTFPVTYGSGSVKLDINGGSTCTQSASAITAKNRAPTTFASGDLLYLISNDGGTTWTIINRYCP